MNYDNKVMIPSGNNSLGIDQSSLGSGSFGHSWSRSPRRKMKSSSEAPVITEVVIVGTATIVFQDQGDTFQGCLSSNSDTYSFSGSRQYDSHLRMDGNHQETRGRRNSCDTDSSGSSFTEECIFGDAKKHSRRNSSDSDSCEDLELGSGEKVYQSSLFDFQTSCHHKLGEVRATLENDQCCIKSDNVEFTSSLSFRGAAASKVIHQNIGPSVSSIDSQVFQGEMRIRWKEFVVPTPVQYNPNSHSTYAHQLRTKSGIVD